MSEPGEIVTRAEAALRAGDASTARALAADLEPGEAAQLLRLLIEANPDDARAWRELGLAAAESGQVDQAAQAFKRAVRLQPDDIENLVHLANASFALGRADEAIELLQRAIDRRPGEPSLLHNLLEMLTASGRAEAALDVASRLAVLEPGNVRTALAAAELCLAVGDSRAALRAFARLGSVDDHEGHSVYAAHGRIEALLRDGQWRGALDAAIEATRLDRHQLTTELLSYAATRLFGPGDHPCLPWQELEATLAAERDEHRLLHDEELPG